MCLVRTPVFRLARVGAQVGWWVGVELRLKVQYLGVGRSCPLTTRTESPEGQSRNRQGKSNRNGFSACAASAAGCSFWLSKKRLAWFICVAVPGRQYEANMLRKSFRA